MLRFKREAFHFVTRNRYMSGDRRHCSRTLLPQPVYRYSDPNTGLIDGSLFLFAIGTNPEVFLFVECHGKDGEPRAWQYGVARRPGR